SNRPDPETMATPPSASRGTTRRTFDRRVLLALAAVVSLIIVGLYQFDQVVASIYAYAFGAFPRIVGSPVPSDRWTVALLNIFLVGLFLALAPFRIKGSWRSEERRVGKEWKHG